MPEKRIKFLSLDVDGVLTDGGIYITENGFLFKKFNVRDGVAIKNVIKAGIQVGFISAGAKSKKILNIRAKMLGVKYVYAGNDEKLDVLKKWCKKLKIKLSNVAHVADDVNDLKIISAVGLSACPQDAVAEIKKASDIILKSKGGNGCIREFIENHLL